MGRKLAIDPRQIEHRCNRTHLVIGRHHLFKAERIKQLSLTLLQPTHHGPCTALSLLLENARRKTVRIWAEQAPFDLKDELKKRGYRWSSGDEGRPKAWYVDIDEAKRDDEIAYLRKFIYLRDVDLFAQTLSAFDRFSVRI